jgi:hypothetical protein
LTLVALTVVFFGKGWVRVSVIHMAMSVVSSLAICGIVAQSISGRGVASRLLVAAALAIAFAFTLVWLSGGLTEASRNVVWALDSASWELPTTQVPPEAGSCHMPAGLERMACFRMDSSTARTALYVQQHTRPDDPVFVGLSRHDMIYINDVLLYFIVNRRSITKWHQYDPGLQTTALIQQQMIEALEREKPKLIVIEAIWLDRREPNDASVSSGVTVLDDYIRRAFEPIATFGVNTVMRPRPEQQR